MIKTIQSQREKSVACNNIMNNRNLNEAKSELKKGYYKIYFNLGERIFKLRCSSEQIANKWVEAVNMSMRTTRELDKSKTHKTKNVSKLLELHKSNKLKSNLETKYGNLLNKDWEKVEDLLEACKKVKDDLIIVSYNMNLVY